MANPTYVTTTISNSPVDFTATNTATARTTPSYSPGSGDVLVAAAVSDDAGGEPITSISGGPAWSQQYLDNTYNKCAVALYTATAAGGAITTAVNLNKFGNAFKAGVAVLQFTGSDGIGAKNTAQQTTGTPSVSLTTTQDNSAVVMVVGDWAAVTGTSAFSNVNSTPAEVVDYADGTNYAAHIAYWPDVGAAGAKTFAMSAPSGQNWTAHVIEIKGTAGGSQTVNVTGLSAASAVGDSPLVRGIDMVVTEAVAEIVSSSNVTTYDFSSVTLPPNQLIVVLAGVRGTVATGSVANVSGDTLSWTKKGSFTFNAGADTMYVHYARTPAKTQASVYRVDVTGDAGTGCIAYMFAVDGALESGDPIVQLGNGSAASTNATATFGAARDTNNSYLAAWFGALSSSNPANVSTPPTGWTEIGDNGFATPTTNGSAAYKVKGETGTTVAFTNSSTTWGAIAAEIKTNLGTDLNYTPAGVSATGAVGSGSVQAASNYTATGQAATSARGTPTVTAAASYTIPGRSAAASVGTPTVTLGQDVSTTLVGRSAAASVGSVLTTQAVSYTIPGRSSVGSVGSVLVATGNLSWSPVGGATTYRIYYGTTASNYSTFINAGNVLEYPISSLPFGANTTYYLMVRAWNGAAETDAWASEHVVLNGIEVSNPYLVFLSSGIGATSYLGPVTTGVGVQVPISLGGGTLGTPSFIGAVGTAFGLSSGTSKQSPALATTSGDYIVVTLNDYDAPGVAVSSVQDTAGNVYILAGTVQSNDANHHQQTWYTPDPIVGNGSNVVTVGFSGGSGNWVVVAQNVFRWPNTTGIQFDTEASLSAPIGTNQTSATLTVSGANEIIVGEWAGWAGTPGAFSNGTATIMWQDASPADAASGYRLAATPGVYSIGATNSSSSAQYAISAKSFKATASAATQALVGNVIVTANASVSVVGRSAVASVGAVIAGVTTAVQIVGQGAVASVGGVTVQTQSGTSVNIIGIQATSYLGIPRAFGGTLIWTAPPEGATSYKLYWGTTTGVYTAILDVGNVTSYPLASLGLLSNRTYYMVVTAVNPAGESPVSSEIIVLNGGELPPPYTLAQVSGRSVVASVGVPLAKTDVSFSILGRQATTALGSTTVTTTGNATVNIIGIGASTSVGSVGVTSPVSVTAPSLLASLMMGNVVVMVPNQSVNALAIGIPSSAFAGNPTVVAPATVPLVGTAATSLVGIPTASVSTPVTILGQGSTAHVGTMTVQGVAVVAPTGILAASSLGSPSVRIPSVNPVVGFGLQASLTSPLTVQTGVDYPVQSIYSFASLGAVSITMAGDVSVGVQGISAITSKGDVAVSGDALVTVSSPPLTTSLSSSAQVSCSVSVPVIGLPAQASHGIVSVNTSAGEAIVTVTGIGAASLLGGLVVQADANVEALNPYYLSVRSGSVQVAQSVDYEVQGIIAYGEVGIPTGEGDAAVICPSLALETIVGMVNAINVIPETSNIQGIGATAILGKVYVRTHGGGPKGRVDLKFPQQVRKLTFPKDYT